MHHYGSNVDPPDHQIKHAGTRPSEILPREDVRSLFGTAQRIKEAYGDVEKGKRGYKGASIQDGTVHLSCQLLAGKLVRKNRPTQVTGFIVNLVGKCTEGM
jgi:hypothetical protein